jgi:hypothetical protein
LSQLLTAPSGLQVGERHSEVDVLRAKLLQLLLDVYDKSTVAQCSVTVPIDADVYGDGDSDGDGDGPGVALETDSAFRVDDDEDSGSECDGEAGNGSDSREQQYTLLLRLMMANLQRSSKARNLSPLDPVLSSR